MAKFMSINEATEEYLESIEGIDSSLAQTIITARQENPMLGFSAISKLTGISKSVLKKHLVEPDISDVCQYLHGLTSQQLHKELAPVKDEIAQIHQITEDLQEQVGSLNIRVNKIEQAQLQSSTIQFKNPSMILDGDKVDKPEQEEIKISELVDKKNKQAEMNLGTKMKTYSTPIGKPALFNFPKFSPITENPGSMTLQESFTNTNVQDEMYASANSTITNSVESPEKGPTASPHGMEAIKYPNVEADVFTENLTPWNGKKQANVITSYLPGGQGPMAPPIDPSTMNQYATFGQGPMAPPINANNSESKEKGQPVLMSNKNINDVNYELPHSVASTIIPHSSTTGMPNNGTGIIGVHAAAPFWSNSIPPPAMYGPAGAHSVPIFNSSIGQATLSSQTVPQWTTPILTSTSMPSSNLIPATPKQGTFVNTAESSRRSRTRKRCQRESSSSSGESIERESSRWKETMIRDKSRSPQPPKMPVFTGSGTLSWEAFIYQFERTSSRRNWDNDKKTLQVFGLSIRSSSGVCQKVSYFVI